MRDLKWGYGVPSTENVPSPGGRQASASGVARPKVLTTAASSTRHQGRPQFTLTIDRVTFHYYSLASTWCRHISEADLVRPIRPNTQQTPTTRLTNPVLAFVPSAIVEVPCGQAASRSTENATGPARSPQFKRHRC